MQAWSAAFLVESHVSVKGWGEPKQQNPKRFEVGYGTGEEVVKARLENRWMRRQLERCYLGHADVLPQALSVSFTISPDGKLGGRRIQGADAKVRACVDEVFGWVEFPSRRDGSLVHNGTTLAVVTGTLELRLAGTAP